MFQKRENRRIKLGTEGFLTVYTDIHGNLKIFNKAIKNWNSSDPDDHICFAGDLIHGRCAPEYDKSPEILDIVGKNMNKSNFHVLFGNHEFTSIYRDAYLFKNMQVWRRHFNKSVRSSKGKKMLHEHLSRYENIMSKFNLCLTTANGLFVTHAGPSGRDYHYNVSDFLWNTIIDGDYECSDVDNFLAKNGYKFMVVGHTEVGGYRFIGNQLIMNSNHHDESTTPTYFLEIDLSEHISKYIIKQGLRIVK